ncbi:hypothetical protein SAMN04487943_11764 [Gracilibacillus orientalis]|uniref:Uncharacterized protein n=1 Tax=Gracilibacillus orientalis TaxID=334253 RepID=A0A1I4QPA3_9BACI|nr:hypothetical protein [Gracilibacillus orientalis]SFM41938.1 hypothetical protein SAMN04487943_11764 [Gracilibacillus orientalis]
MERWKDYSISIADKTTVAAVAGAIAAYITFIGPVLGAGGMETGHFTAKSDYRILDGSHIEQRQTLMTWDNASHDTLLDISTGYEEKYTGI